MPQCPHCTGTYEDGDLFCSGDESGQVHELNFDIEVHHDEDDLVAPTPEQAPAKVSISEYADDEDVPVAPQPVTTVDPLEDPADPVSRPDERVVEATVAPTPAGSGASIEPVAPAPVPEELPIAPPVPATPPDTCERCGAVEMTCSLCERGAPTPTLILTVEGPPTRKVRFLDREVKHVLQATDRLHLGRRDPFENIYPEIDLTRYWREEQAPVSRRHAEIIRRPDQGGRHFLRCSNDNRTTHLQKAEGDLEPLERNDERELADGDRIVIADEVAFTVSVPKE